MINAIGYVRRSTDRQEESLDQQKRKLETFAKSQGWTLSTIYVDDAISGSEMTRPGLSDLLDAAKTRDDVQYVIAWDRNRLARPKDAVDGMMLERQLISAGKRVVYAATGQEADRSFASGLISYVEHHQNGDYLRKLSRDTVRGLVSRVERGMWPGGPIPFGYDRLLLDEQGNPKRIVRDMEDSSQVIIDPESGKVLERISAGRRFKKQDHESCTLIPSDAARVRALQALFAGYAAGKPVRLLRDTLNETGFRTSRGQTFTNSTINPILENPAYIGQCVYNRRTLSKWHRVVDGKSVERQDEGIEQRPESDWIVTDNAWPAIIDKDVFDQVQHRRKDSKEKHKHTTGANHKSGYLLTGHMFCGVCGGKLCGTTKTSGKGIKTRYYVCQTHHNGHHDRCPKRYAIPAKLVENHILDAIKTDLAKLKDDKVIHKYIAEELQRITGGKGDARKQLQQRMIELEQKIERKKDHIDHMPPALAKKSGFYDDLANLLSDQEDLEMQLKAVSVPCADDLPDSDELHARAVAAFDDLETVLAGGTLEEKREMIGHYVQTIKADPDHSQIHIGLYPALVSRKIAGAGFEPTTSGL
jgi:site-specific DNA recombinase